MIAQFRIIYYWTIYYLLFYFDGDFRVIGLAIVADASLPLVMTRVGEVETALYLLESDAMTATVAGGLGMIGILDVACDGVFAGLQADMYKRGLRGADAVLEGILDERDEDHGRYL